MHLCTVVAKLTAVVGAKYAYGDQTVDRAELTKLLPKSQDELPPRAMKVSGFLGILSFW